MTPAYCQISIGRRFSRPAAVLMLGSVALSSKKKSLIVHMYYKIKFQKGFEILPRGQAHVVSFSAESPDVGAPPPFKFRTLGVAPCRTQRSAVPS